MHYEDVDFPNSVRISVTFDPFLLWCGLDLPTVAHIDFFFSLMSSH